MRSKTSYFNPTLFKKNLARFWPLWGGASLLGALLPLYFLIALIDNGFRNHVGDGLGGFQSTELTGHTCIFGTGTARKSLTNSGLWRMMGNARMGETLV